MESKLLSLGIDVEKRVIILSAPIDDEALRFMQIAFQALDRSAGPFTVRLTTGGGDVESGLGIYDLISEHKDNATIIVDGFAYSMGGVILQAAGRRLAMPHSHVMLHFGYQGVEDTNQENFKRKLKHSAKLDDICNEVVWNRMRERWPKMRKATVVKKTENDWYLSPMEAMEEGLLDGLVY